MRGQCLTVSTQAMDDYINLRVDAHYCAATVRGMDGELDKTGIHFWVEIEDPKETIIYDLTRPGSDTDSPMFRRSNYYKAAGIIPPWNHGLIRLNKSEYRDYCTQINDIEILSPEDGYMIMKKIKS